jgi:hypothetical protein
MSNGIPMDYEPIDLSTLCNASIEAFERAPVPGIANYNTASEIPIGAQIFHGIPFEIGRPANPASPCFIAFGEGAKLYQAPVRVPIKKAARYVIFAHTLLETELWKGGPVGEEVARYVIHYTNGEQIQVPIRERFEVGNFPFAFGQKPFLCVTDTKNYLLEPYNGPWDQSGWRHTEVKWGQPRGYYLYAWANPYPDRDIQEIELIPKRYRFIVAGVTLGHLDEFPFVRTTRQPVKVTLTEDANTAPPFSLKVEVDRGVATYPYPLSAEPLDLVDRDRAGFGAPFNQGNSPAYTEIAALPSATITIKQKDELLGQVRWGLLKDQGSIQLPKMRLEVLGPGKNWVHVKVLDEETDQILPCRVAFHSQEGLPYPPHGHHAPVYSNLDTWNDDIGGDVRLGQISYAYIDGQCQGWLPRGRVLVDAAAGFEYEPFRDWVSIEPGQERLVLRLRRVVNMNAEGWYSGDTHVHFLSTIGSQTEARGEGLNVVNLLQSQWGHLFSNTEEFTGRPHTSPDGRTIVYASQENRQHMFGHLSLLGLKEPVMPWGSGGPSEAELGGGLDITLSDWADACHAQGGTVVVPHLGVTNGEQAALIATERADAVEMLTHNAYFHHEYYRYLNAGYRLPLAGGTDKMDAGVPVGLYRTYVHIPAEEPFTYESWCRSLRAGRTFLSGGALIWLSVEGQPIGSTLQIAKGGQVEVEARAQSIFPLHTLQIVDRGQVVAENSNPHGVHELTLRARLPVKEDTWLAARCGGPGYSAIPHYDSWGRGLMAHTSPVYLSTGIDYSLFDVETAHYMLTLIEGNLAYIKQLSPQHDPQHTSYPHGKVNHQEHLAMPFQEARDAIHRRLHAWGIPH